jgi:hypothetical protein
MFTAEQTVDHYSDNYPASLPIGSRIMKQGTLSRPLTNKAEQWQKVAK